LKVSAKPCSMTPVNLT